MPIQTMRQARDRNPTPTINRCKSDQGEFQNGKRTRNYLIPNVILVSKFAMTAKTMKERTSIYHIRRIR